MSFTLIVMFIFVVASILVGIVWAIARKNSNSENISKGIKTFQSVVFYGVVLVAIVVTVYYLRN